MKTGFEDQDLRTLLDRSAALHADRPFLIWAPFEGHPTEWSYAGFLQTVRRFAAGLEGRGLGPGDRLLVHLDNCPESLICWFGCAYAGVTPVTTNARSSEAELAYFAEHSRARAAVTQPRLSDLVTRAAPHLEWLAVTELDNGEAPRLPPSPRARPFEQLLADERELKARAPDPLAPFAIQYTSGTTARPKAVLWSHANALWGAKLSAMHEALTSADVHLVTLPLFHTNAQVYSVLASLEVGATVVLQPRFSASRFWNTSLRYGCTWTSMVPFCLKALARLPIPAEHSFRLWGNAVCEPPTDALFGVKTIGWWGMTETVTHGIVGSPHHANAPLSLGRPSPGYGVHVLKEDGSPAAPGETGELFIEGRRGLSLFLEYADDAAATAAAFREDGLLITGDRVTVGSEGALFFADRAKDMLKVGGENVAASDIETAILGVAGVAEVAVVAQNDELLDEIPVAFVIAEESAPPGLPALIIETCQKSLAAFKVPRHVILVEALPRSTLNKVAKSELRRRLVAN